MCTGTVSAVSAITGSPLPLTFTRTKTTAAGAAAAAASIFNLETKDHCIYTTSEPPTQSQLQYAHTFFDNQEIRLLWTHNRFAEIPLSIHPEILFLGRTNVGKSSLINLLVSKQICKSSRIRQATRRLDAFEVGPPGRQFTIIDSPGYGSRAREDWGPLMEKFITQRKGLQKCFVIIDASVGPKSTDEDLLRFLQYSHVPYQILASKADKILIPGPIRNDDFISKMKLEFRHQLQSLNKILLEPLDRSSMAEGDLISYCGWRHQRRFGINHVRWALLRAVGLA
ncbi:hypothetical protein KEM54_006846 [Ascosphaera aggregata]|nr:hypothetical protein KEM54_006846 [Ascosphaera aggregata]